MNDTQLTTLGTHIRQNAAVADFLANGNLGGIRDWYNADHESLKVWKTSVSIDQANEVIDWNEFDDVPVVGEDTIAGLKATMRQSTQYARQNTALSQLFRNGDFNAGKANVRASLANIFGENSVAALLVIAQRPGRNVELLFGTVAGTAYEMTFEGSVSTSDIDLALELTA